MANDDSEWKRRSVENALAAIDLQRLYLAQGGPSETWAKQVLQTAEDLGTPLQASVVVGYASLTTLILAAIADAGGGEPLAVLDKMEAAARRMPGSAQR